MSRLNGRYALACTAVAAMLAFGAALSSARAQHTHTDHSKHSADEHAKHMAREKAQKPKKKPPARKK